MKAIIVIIFSFFAAQLCVAQCYPDRHSTNWFDGWMSCEKTPSPNKLRAASHWIMYEFESLYKIDAIKLWNYNDPAHLDWGAAELSIDYSEDGITWTFGQNINLLKATGLNDYEGMSWMDINLPRAKYVLITVLNNFKGNCAGFAEIRFSAEKIKLNTAIDAAEHENLLVDIAPNPFVTECQIAVESLSDGLLQYAIYNPLGNKIKEAQINIQQNKAIFRIDMSNYPSGTYYLDVYKSGQHQRSLLIKL